MPESDLRYVVGLMTLSLPLDIPNCRNHFELSALHQEMRSEATHGIELVPRGQVATMTLRMDSTTY
jgi:hypothetical protein